MPTVQDYPLQAPSSGSSLRNCSEKLTVQKFEVRALAVRSGRVRSDKLELKGKANSAGIIFDLPIRF